MHDWLEQRIVACSSDAIGGLLGLPSPLGDESAPATTPPAMDSYRLAERLWTSDLAATIESRLRALETLNKGTRLIALASTIPSPTVRTALLRTLEQHWDEGPGSITMLGAMEGTTVELGFVALVKMLRRSDPVDPAGRNGNRPHIATKTAKKSTDAQEYKKRQEKVAQQWMEFSQSILQATCRQLCGAALAKQHDQSGGSPTADDADLPFKLRPHATVAAVYHLDWPDEFNGKLAAAPMLRVRFARTTEKATPASVLAFYRRQVSNGKEHTHDDGGWIDSILVDELRAHSVDVFVTKASVLGPPNQEQELTVDVLTIECEGIAKPSTISASR
jgi:hypothetical protein